MTEQLTGTFKSRSTRPSACLPRQLSGQRRLILLTVVSFFLASESAVFSQDVEAPGTAKESDANLLQDSSQVVKTLESGKADVLPVGDKKRSIADVVPDVVIVQGAGGLPEYTKEFDAWRSKWTEFAKQGNASLSHVGSPKDSEKPEEDRAVLLQTLAGLETEKPADVWIVFLGHGTFSRGSAKFNLRGPDISATDLEEALKPLKRRIILINCSSSSGPFINQLSGEDRVIVTATRSGEEQNFSRFGGFFIDALAGSDADLDHDEQVSVHEAFLAASELTRLFYLSEGRIPSEHALIDDNGDQKGTPASAFQGLHPVKKPKSGTQFDGRLGVRTVLTAADQQIGFTLQERRQRDQLETSLDQLRSEKDSLSVDEYQQRLEEILIPLAKLYQQADSRGDSR